MAAADISALRQTPPIWENMADEIVLASGVRLLRNLNRFKFACKLDEQAKGQVLRFISKALLDHPKLKNPIIAGAELIWGDDKELLTERFLFLEGINQASHGEAFAFDESGRFLALLNLCEHLQLMLITPGDRIDRLLGELIAIESHLSQQLDFAYNGRFGFLTAQPKHCGTGLVATMMLHMPALVQSQQIEVVLEQLPENEVNICGLTQDGFVADVIILENKHTIGVSEEKIIAGLQSLASRLSIAEISQRKELQNKGSSHIKDRVARAYGLVRHSYMLDAKEAMQAVSLLKLGLLMGWVNGIDLVQTNQWLFRVQRSHLRCQQGIRGEPFPIDRSNIDHERALAMHEMLKKCELVI